jgi:hypothetical protein
MADQEISLLSDLTSVAKTIAHRVWGYSRSPAASRARLLSTCTDQRTTLPSSRVKTWKKELET